jgi:hypothetical protein
MPRKEEATSTDHTIVALEGLKHLWTCRIEAKEFPEVLVDGEEATILIRV